MNMVKQYQLVLYGAFKGLTVMWHVDLTKNPHPILTPTYQTANILMYISTNP